MTDKLYLTGFTNYANSRDVSRARASLGKYHDAISVRENADGTLTINYLRKTPVHSGQCEGVGEVTYGAVK